jgi:hypothetical protein
MTDHEVTPAVRELLPVLAVLDNTAITIESQQASGQPVDATRVAEYTLHGDHARHLAQANDITKDDLQAAAREHRGDGAPGFETRGLAHALAPQAWTTAAPDAQQPERSDDEEIDL